MTDTTYHALNKQAKGTTNWHTALNNNLDIIDARLPRAYAGDPNGNVAGEYVGQPVYDSTNSKLYHCSATGNAATATWVALSGFPAGGIIMWSGTIATIPAGWYLCDGNNGTPDLRDKFIVGAKQDDSGTAKTNLTGALTQTGGNTSVTSGAGGDHDHGGSTGSYTLTTSDIPSHSHAAGTLSAASNGAHTHNLASVRPAPISSSGGVAANGTGGSPYATTSDGAHTHTITGSTATAGSGGGHSHTISSSGTHTHSVTTIPPYFALAFIMKA